MGWKDVGVQLARGAWEVLERKQGTRVEFRIKILRKLYKACQNNRHD